MTLPLPRPSASSRALQIAGVLVLHALLLAALLQRHSLPETQERKTPLFYITLPAERPAPPAVAAVPRAPQTPRRASQPTTADPSPRPAPAEPQAITAVPPTEEPNPTPAFDMEAAKRIAREADRQRARSDLARLNDQWQRDGSMEKKLGDDVARAARKDCLHAYSGAGLLAPLAAGIDLLRGKTCKF